MKCGCGAHREVKPACPSIRVAQLSRTEPMRGCGRGMYGGHAVPAAAHRVRGAVPGSSHAWGVPPRPLPPRPAPLLRPRAARAHPRVALLPVRQHRVRRAPAPDLCACLRLLGARPGAALLPRALRRLRAQPRLQVRAGAGHGGGGAGEAGRGRLSLPPSRCTTQAPPPGLPGLLRACSQRPRRLPAGPGPELPARLRWPRGYALSGSRRGRGSPRWPPPWTDYSPRGVPIGTAVTPNYLDNASARVAPWCDCGVSGNRREECEAFRGLFTRNRCLGEEPGGVGRGRSAVTAAYQAAWPAGAHFRGEKTDAR